MVSCLLTYLRWVDWYVGLGVGFMLICLYVAWGLLVLYISFGLGLLDVGCSWFYFMGFYVFLVWYANFWFGGFSVAW